MTIVANNDTTEAMEAATPPVTLARAMSVSEATESGGGHSKAPVWLSFIEYPFHVADPVTGKKLPEAAGWAMDASARGPLNLVGGYLGQAILRLATLDAGCQAPNGCTAKIYGVKPSSLLTIALSLAGFVAAIIMPVAGAVVDHTTHRRMVGLVSGIVSVALVGMQISIRKEPNNWLFILVLDAIQSLAQLVHTTAVFAYLPDLSLDQEVTSHYTSRFNFIQFVSQFAFIGCIILIGQLNSRTRSLDDSIQTAKEAAGIAFAFGAIFIAYAWAFLFRARPALSKVPEGQTLINTGFKQVTKTSKKIWNDYRALRWFMISLLWSPEAGAGVVLAIAITYLTVLIHLSALDFAKLNILLIVGNLIGSLWSKIAVRILNPLNSYRISLFSLASAVGLSIFCLKGPEDRNKSFVFGVLWGIAMGWVYPSQKVLMCHLIPKGQETEMMGLFVFAGQVIGWLLPLLFTIMNEKDFSLRWSMSLVSWFCLAALFCTLFMGDYDVAVDQVARDSETKLADVVVRSVHLSPESALPEKSSNLAVWQSNHTKGSKEEERKNSEI